MAYPHVKPTPDFLLWAHQLKREHAFLLQRVEKLEAPVIGQSQAGSGLNDDVRDGIEARLVELEKRVAKEIHLQSVVEALENQMNGMEGRFSLVEDLRKLISAIESRLEQSFSDTLTIRSTVSLIHTKLSEQSKEINFLDVRSEGLEKSGKEQDQKLHDVVKSHDARLQEIELDVDDISQTLDTWEIRLMVMERQAEQHEKHLLKPSTSKAPNVSNATDLEDLSSKIDHASNTIPKLINAMQHHFGMLYAGSIDLQRRVHDLDGLPPQPDTETQFETQPNFEGRFDEECGDFDALETQARAEVAGRALIVHGHDEAAKSQQIVHPGAHSIGDVRPPEDIWQARKRRRMAINQPARPQQQIDSLTEQHPISNGSHRHQGHLPRARTEADSVSLPHAQPGELRDLESDAICHIRSHPRATPSVRSMMANHQRPPITPVTRRQEDTEIQTLTPGFAAVNHIDAASRDTWSPGEASSASSPFPARAREPVKNLKSINDAISYTQAPQSTTQVRASSPASQMTSPPPNISQTQFPTPSITSSRVFDSVERQPTSPICRPPHPRKRTIAERELDILPYTQGSEAANPFSYTRDNTDSQVLPLFRLPATNNVMDKRMAISLSSHMRQTRSQTKVASLSQTGTMASSQVRGMVLGGTTQLANTPEEHLNKEGKGKSRGLTSKKKTVSSSQMRRKRQR